MKVIGFNFTQNDFRYAVLEDISKPPTIIDKNKFLYPLGFTTPELMEWLETQLMLIIQKHNPDKISHKISLNLPSLDRIRNSCYPQAILNLVSQKSKIPISSFSSTAINATKFGQPQKTDVFKYIDPIIGTHPPYWDKSTKEAVLVAWFNIL